MLFFYQHKDLLSKILMILFFIINHRLFLSGYLKDYSLKYNDCICICLSIGYSRLIFSKHGLLFSYMFSIFFSEKLSWFTVFNIYLHPWFGFLLKGLLLLICCIFFVQLQYLSQNSFPLLSFFFFLDSSELTKWLCVLYKDFFSPKKFGCKLTTWCFSMP